MNSMASLALLIFILTVWDSTRGSKQTDHKPKVRCDQLYEDSINATDAIRIMSFTVTHSISPSFNCSKAIYIKPIAPAAVGNSFIITQGDRVFYFNYQLLDGGKTAMLTECVSGMNTTWHYYRVRLQSDTDGYFCAYICSSDGVLMQQFVCLSAGNSVNRDITKDVVPYMRRNVPGGDAIFDAHSNCDPTKCT